MKDGKNAHNMIKVRTCISCGEVTPLVDMATQHLCTECAERFEDEQPKVGENNDY